MLRPIELPLLDAGVLVVRPSEVGCPMHRTALFALLTGCSLQLGEVAEVTARDGHRGSSTPGGVTFTVCEAWVPYEAGGETLRARDISELLTPGQPVESCPFEVGQPALVWIGDTPETTRVLTASGRTWWLLGGALLIPLLLGARLVRARGD